jgi:hypothetical protein
MADSGGIIEYYKLAAAIIPVLWVGQALLLLDPKPALDQAEPLLTRLGVVTGQTAAAVGAGPSAELLRRREELADRINTLLSSDQRDSIDPAVQLERMRLTAEYFTLNQVEVAEQLERSKPLLAENRSVQKTWHSIAKPLKPMALLAIVAPPLAVLSEALSLAGVATNDSSQLYTIGVTLGLSLGAAFLILPIWARWLKILDAHIRLR